jgi:hypothetical protein
MQQQLRRVPPPQKPLAIVILMVGVLALVLAGNIVSGWFSSADPLNAGRAHLTSAITALEAQQPNRAARLASEALALFEQAAMPRFQLRAAALETRALQSAGRTADAAQALQRTLALRARVGPDQQASATLAALFVTTQRYGLAVQYALEAAGRAATAGQPRGAAELLTTFAGQLALAGAPQEAVRLYAEAIPVFVQLDLGFQAAQLYERIGITLAPTDPAAAYAAYIEAINRLMRMGEHQRADAVRVRLQQLPKTFLETIIE